MASIKDSFDSAFRDKTTHNNASIDDDTDSDSAAEQKKVIEEKRQKKRRRTNNRSSKSNRCRKPVSKFKITRTAPKESVTEQNRPEILSVEEEFSMSETNKELIVAEQKYFNAKNKDPWERGNHNHVLPQHFPFVRALVQRNPIETFDIHQMNDRERFRSKIEAVPRAYEESFLCEPIGSQRPCLRGSQCEGLNITMAGDRAFILREFLLPSEQKKYEETGKYRPESRLCLMCKRTEIARGYINTRAAAMGISDDSILQDYRNIVNVEGEYNLKDCILSSRHVYEGLIDPIILHIRSAYRLIEKDGVRHYEQWRMGYPSQTQHFLFQAPSN